MAKKGILRLFLNEKPLEYGGDYSPRRSIKHWRLISDTLLCIEKEKNEHMRYTMEDEELRYLDITDAFPYKCIFIRYNPGAFIDRHGQPRNPGIKERRQKLQEAACLHIERIGNEENEDQLEVFQLYFDGYQ